MRGCSQNWSTVSFVQTAGFISSDVATCDVIEGTISYIVNEPCQSFVEVTAEPAITILSKKCFYLATDSYLEEAGDDVEILTQNYNLPVGLDWVYFD